MKKLFLCIGAAKTGTTWLYHNIRANPDLWFTPEKELNYFFTRYGRFDRLTPEIRDRKRQEALKAQGRHDWNDEARLAWYDRFVSGEIDDKWCRSLFEEMPADRWACDFSPSTSLIGTEGWEAVSRFAPEIRVVYILREPRSRLWSHVKFHAKFIGRLDEFRTMSLKEMNRFINHYSLTEDGDYGGHLQRLLTHVPREHVLLLDHAEISRAPHEILRRVEAHLGLGETPDHDGKLKERVNVSESLPRPEGFGGAYVGRFHREMRLLAEQGVAFARPWAEHYRRENGLLRRLGRLIGG